MRLLVGFKTRRISGRWVGEADHHSDYVRGILRADIERYAMVYGVFHDDTILAWKPLRHMPWKTPQALYDKRRLETYITIRGIAASIEADDATQRASHTRR